MSKLKLAIQKSGRLSEKSLDLIRESGIRVSNGSRKLQASASNFPLEVLYLRDDDIPQYVAEGVADIGIVGKNEVLEQAQPVEIKLALGFAKCSMCLALPREVEYNGLEYFRGKRIATSYPTILNSFFNEKGIAVAIEKISGSVEIAPGIGLAEGIFDIVSTGSTLMMNGLKAVETLVQSEAVLIANPRLISAKEALLNQLMFRIRAVNAAKVNKYILLNAPNRAVAQICTVLPGMKSPTVLPLAESNWSSIHAVIPEDDFWNVIDKLRGLGAQGILVSPIEKMIV